MVAAGNLCRAINAITGEAHAVVVAPDGDSMVAHCVCGYQSSLEASVFDAWTAAFLEHLEFIAFDVGVPFDLP